jgi:hypothetical protein
LYIIAHSAVYYTTVHSAVRNTGTVQYSVVLYSIVECSGLHINSRTYIDLNMRLPLRIIEVTHIHDTRTDRHTGRQTHTQHRRDLIQGLKFNK